MAAVEATVALRPVTAGRQWTAKQAAGAAREDKGRQVMVLNKMADRLSGRLSGALSR